MTENELSYIIRGAIFKVYNQLGPGLLESGYVLAIAHEQRKAGLNIKKQHKCFKSKNFSLYRFRRN